MIDVGQFPLKGHLALATATDSELTYLWMLGGNLATLTVTDEGVTLATDASPEQVAMLEAALRGDEPAWHAPGRNLFTLAQSAVGVAIADLSAPQIKALLALVLWDKKAIGNDLKVRPLRDWVKRRPSDAP